MAAELVRRPTRSGLDPLPADEEWDALVAKSDGGPFERPGWIRAWANSFSGAPLEAVTVRRGSELVGLIPLVRTRFGVRAPINSHTPSFSPLALDPDAMEDLAARLYAVGGSNVELGLLGEEPVACFRRVAERAGRPVLERQVRSSPYIDLKGTYDEYLASLSKNRRKSIRRNRRRLEERGSVAFEVYDGTTGGLDVVLEELYAIEASGWKGRRGTAISSHTVTRDLYTGVAGWAAAEGTLRIAMLRLDEQPIACDYAIEQDGVWYSLKAGYDEAMRSFGPGALLLQEEVSHCFSTGVRRFDLLGTTDEFKASWTDREEPKFWMRAFGRDPIGMACWGVIATRERVRPLARAIRLRVEQRRLKSPRS